MDYPVVVSEYHKIIDRVDSQDQRRLQRYSLRICFHFRKYFKSLFMGVLDLVIVNAFVTQTKCAKDTGSKQL